MQCSKVLVTYIQMPTKKTWDHLLWSSLSHQAWDARLGILLIPSAIRREKCHFRFIWSYITMYTYMLFSMLTMQQLFIKDGDDIWGHHKSEWHFSLRIRQTGWAGIYQSCVPWPEWLDWISRRWSHVSSLAFWIICTSTLLTAITRSVNQWSLNSLSPTSLSIVFGTPRHKINPFSWERLLTLKADAVNHYLRYRKVSPLWQENIMISEILSGCPLIYSASSILQRTGYSSKSYFSCFWALMVRVLL